MPPGDVIGVIVLTNQALIIILMSLKYQTHMMYCPVYHLVLLTKTSHSTLTSLDLALKKAVRLSVTSGPSQIRQTHSLKLLIWARQVSRIGRVLGLAKGVGPLNIHPTVPRPKTQITGCLSLSTAMVCLVNMQSWPTWSLILTRMCWFSRRLSSTILSIRLNFCQKVIVVLSARTKIDQVEVSCLPSNLITV